MCQLIAKHSPEAQEDEFRAALLLIRSALIRKEQDRKPPIYAAVSECRDGLDCLNFFFDLINHAAGYTDKYYEQHLSRTTQEQLIEKYRRESKKHEGNPQDSELLGDKHPHCLVVIQGAHTLYRMSGPENFSQDYLDALILRLNVSELSD